ncbi:MAG: hypothetical protein WCK78_04295 [Paludibacter sp.]
MAKVFKLDQEAAHFNRIDAYAQKIEQLYLSAVQEAASISSSVKLPDGKMFTFDGFPNAKSKVDKLISSLTQQMSYYINEATGKEWYEASANKKKLIEQFAATTELTKSQLESYNSRNLEALKAFQNRKTNGLGLSDRVWNYTNQFKGELEMGLDIGIGEGKSAAELSRDLRSYLNDPDKLFRRVRDKHGNLQLSKNAAKYSPGSGQYRSSYKNAMRLTRTEINMAYRESDYLKNQQLDFVVGFKVVRSNHYFDCVVCNSLKGDYPKSFKFVGWHPHCRCHVEDILASEDEFIKHQKNILDGKPTTLKSDNEVKDLPEGFKGWVADNEERIMQAKQNGTLPYFLRDNFQKDGSLLANSVQKIENKSFGFDAKYNEIDSTIGSLDYIKMKQYLATDGTNTMQGYIGEVQGFNGKPKLVNDVDFALLKSDKENIVLYRGVQGDKEMLQNRINQFKDGDLFNGKGTFGDGSYFTLDKKQALDYGMGSDESVISSVIDLKKCKIADYDELKDIWGSERDQFAWKKIESVNGNILSKIESDQLTEMTTRTYMNFGSWATAKGYDIIYVPTEKYYVVLNRTKLIVKK